MDRSVLVGYSSLTGFTAEVAQAIADELRQEGFEAEARPVRDLGPADIAGRSGVILGTTIRAGRVRGDVISFVKKNQAALAALPVAYFTVGLRMVDGSPEAREETLGYLKGLLDLREPVAAGLFAGALEMKRLSAPVRFLMTRIRDEHGRPPPEGDHRDWKAIRGWAREVTKAFR